MKCDICGKQADDNYLVCSSCFEQILCYDEPRQQLEIYKQALELACYYMEYEYPKQNDDIYYRKAQELEMIFLDQAKKELEKQNVED